VIRLLKAQLAKVLRRVWPDTVVTMQHSCRCLANSATNPNPRRVISHATPQNGTVYTMTYSHINCTFYDYESSIYVDYINLIKKNPVV
jgi:hypothetical protein